MTYSGKKTYKKSLLSSLCTAFILTLGGCQSPEQDQQFSVTPEPAKAQQAIASAHPLATQAGLDILNQGGNAFDAAVAVAASLGVVEPYSAGIGGGGFWLLYSADKKSYTFLDAREKAPSAAHRDMYLNAQGEVDRDKAVNGALAAGIPGQAAAFAHLANNYGQLPLTKTLHAAIQQAEQGFAIDPHFLKLMAYRLKNMQRYSTTSEIFLDQNKQPPKTGTVIQQKELAETLKLLAAKGFDGFYKGQVAEKLVKDVTANGGIWSLQDLANYQVVERAPIKFDYQFAGQHFQFITAPPPSSGGIALAQIFTMLSEFDLDKLSAVDKTHVIVEAMRRAYKDRAEYLGDSDFVQVPVKELMSQQHNQKYAKSILLDKATSSLSLQGPKNIAEGFHTTHFSIADRFGNKVSATLSINLPFGSAYTAKGTGVLLNNEMDDFSAKPGEANAYGLVGNEANAIAANKRPLSSMTPSMIESADQFAILGTPGGSRIITMVMLGALQHLEGKSVDEWVALPRFHHQYLPDVIQHEPDTFNAEQIKALTNKGHKLKNVGRKYGNMQAILINKKTGKISAAADPRAVGSAQVE